ncbi:MAG: arginase family protein [Synergistaceae bacterium]
MAYILEKADRDLFYSRNDPKDRRLGELIHRGKISTVRNFDVVIIGVPEDRGVTANKGRPGAAKGPDDVRRRLYKLTPGFNMDLDRIKVTDAGNISTKGLTLEEVHLALQEAVADAVSMGGIPLVIGGGHDLTYPGARRAGAGRRTEKGLPGPDKRRLRTSTSGRTRTG